MSHGAKYFSPYKKYASTYFACASRISLNFDYLRAKIYATENSSFFVKFSYSSILLKMKPEIPNRFYRVSIKALILDESKEKFLVVQEKNGKWEFPGGGLDWGENPQQGLTRELQEEMGIKVISIFETPSYFFTDKHNSGLWYANVFYKVIVASLEFTPSDECVAIQFVTPEEAKALDAFSNVRIFADMFNLKNHVVT